MVRLRLALVETRAYAMFIQTVHETFETVGGAPEDEELLVAAGVPRDKAESARLLLDVAQSRAARARHGTHAILQQHQTQSQNLQERNHG